MRTLFALATLTSAGLAQAQVIYVDSNATPGGDGSAWGRAFDSLHDALAAASAGDELWVAGGVYVPSAPGGRDATFEIPDGVSVYGGFDGNESTLAQRGDPLSPVTQLSGTTASGSVYHVVTMTTPTTGTRLDGFEIIKGRADGAGARSRGGGVYVVGGVAHLENLRIESCSGFNGSAMMQTSAFNANLTMVACEFANNNVSGAGGVVRLEAPALVQGCSFADNINGPALRLRGDGVRVIQDCDFESNTSVAFPAAVYCDMDDAPTAMSQLIDCRFRDNAAMDTGAVEFIGGGDHEIISCEFTGNESNMEGGALAVFNDASSASVRIENSLLNGNSATLRASAVAIDTDGRVDIINTTVANNKTLVGTIGAVHLRNSSTVSIDNSIIWGNTSGVATQQTSIWQSGFPSLTINRTVIEYLGVSGALLPGVGQIGDNPLYVDADGANGIVGDADDNLRLQPGSPAIDAGDNAFVLVSSDIYGDNRFHDDTGITDTGVPAGIPQVVDMGAAEFQGTTPPQCTADTNGDGMLSPADFNGWIIAFNTQSPACDQNGDGACTPADFNGWIINFNNGCL